MWNSPRLLNAAANGLFALAFALLAWGAMKLFVESPLFLLRSIRVEGELKHVTRPQVVQALDGRLAGTFFNMDLDAVRVLFETIPWVRRAEVRRVWPDRIAVHVEEHAPMARWGQEGENRMVNTHGEVFSAPYGAEMASLPQLAGPAGTAPAVVRRYAQFAAATEPLKLRLAAVMLSPRYSWQVKLSNGLSVQLGRDLPGSEKTQDSVDARLARFVAAYPLTLAPLQRRLDYVDLRYGNGFALRVPGLKDALPASKPGAKPAPTKLPERKTSA